MTSLELLAPARNIDVGIAAISCGADAVYIGGPSFGARVDAGNSVEDIRRLCKAAAPYGVRIYVTVNTLSRNVAELEQMASEVVAMKDMGVSAFILQDTRLLDLLRREGRWKEEFHASTQCAIRTPERALELASMGFTRLILERELSLEQIRAIRQALPSAIELEFFVHGALCVCYSGDCYLSEHLTARSANRGECAQPCRSQYNLVDASGQVIVRNKPLLSLKDLELIDRIPDLAEAGVVSFKIEGRLKNESYVKNVVSAYSSALDAFIESSGGEYARASAGHCSGGFTPNLNKTFNRGYTSLFLDGVRGDWNSGDAAKSMGENIGKIRSAAPRGAGMLLDLSLKPGTTLSNGDGLGCILPGGEICGFRADKVEGSKVQCKAVPELFRQRDIEIWRNRDLAFEKSLENNTPKRLIPVSLSLKMDDSALSVSAMRQDGAVCNAEYDLSGFEMATNRERILSLLHTQLGKSSGIYQFELNHAECGDSVRLLGSAFLNEIRHSLAGRLLQIPIKAAPRPALPQTLPAPGTAHPHREGELMRTRYCLLHQLGLCRRTSSRKLDEPLCLVNNGRKIRLKFDCAACEMVLLK